MLNDEIKSALNAGRLKYGATLWMVDVCYLPGRKSFERNIRPVEVNLLQHPASIRGDLYYVARNSQKHFSDSCKAPKEQRAEFFLTEAEAYQSYKEQAAIALEAMAADHTWYNQRFLNLKVLLLSI